MRVHKGTHYVTIKVSHGRGEYVMGEQACLNFLLYMLLHPSGLENIIKFSGLKFILRHIKLLQTIFVLREGILFELVFILHE